MMRTLLRSKIHRVVVTDANIDYEGSISIDRTLMNAADIHPFELVQVWNVTNGNRFETYVIEEPENSGTICINGAAAHLARTGDVVIVACFVQVPEAEVAHHNARLVFVDAQNRIKSIKEST